MNVELKPIAESKIRQLGGDVCGVLVRTQDSEVMAVSEHGRCTRLDAGVMGPVDPAGMNDTRNEFERIMANQAVLSWSDSMGEYRSVVTQKMWEVWQAARAQGGQGADAVKWSDPAVDPIVSKLYRKFKEWNRQGFGADDVTWCEVRGYVAELLNTQPQPAVPEGWRECLQEMVQAMHDYEMSVEEDAPYKHRAMMDRAHALLSTPATPQADGWVRCEDRLPEPRRQSRKTPNGILAKHESGRITQFRDVTETLLQYMRNGPRKPTKFEQPVSERITEWMDLDAERAGGDNA